MYKSRHYLHIALFLLLVLVLWTGLSFLPGPTYQQLPVEGDSVIDLTDSDMEHTVYRIDQRWESWPERIYTPQELETAEPSVPHTSLDFGTLQYATHRVRIELEPGQIYGISMRSTDYAMRLYLDGEEIDSIGIPGTSREEIQPQVRNEIYYFVPQGQTVELVVQTSNFVHSVKGSDAPALIFGKAENVARYVRNNDIKSGLVFGCLMVAFLYHFAIFLLNRKQRASLIFSLLCLLMALASVEGFITFATGYNWQIAFRLGYAGTILSAGLLILLVDTLFPGAMHKWAVRGYLIFLGAYLLTVIFTDTLIFTRGLVLFHIATVGIIAYFILRLAMTLKQRKRKNILAFLGIVLFGLFIIYDILYRNGFSGVWDVNGSPIVDATTGTVLLVICYAFVLAIEQAEVNLRLEQARAALAHAEARYQELMDEQGITVQDRLSSFQLTKRETDVALLLLDGKNREEISSLLVISAGTVNTHCNHIYQKIGVKNVAELSSVVMSQKPKK